MNSKHSVAFLIASLFVLVVFSPRAFGAPLNACSLLTPAQISVVVGVNVAAGQPTGTKACDWSPPGQPNSLNPKKVTVTLQDAEEFADAKMRVGQNITRTPVRGIGDDAVYSTTPDSATNLIVKRGDLYFTVQVFGFPLEQTKTMERTLAFAILSRL